MINQSFLCLHMHYIQEGTLNFPLNISKLVSWVPLLDVELCQPLADDAIDLSGAFKLSPVSRRERL